MRVVFLDMETYYDKEYSLSKMTTEEYIRDDRFEVVLVSIMEEGGEPQWFSGTAEQTGEWLRGWGLEEKMVVAHNARFDGAILTWRFGIRPKAIGDTLSMARAVHGSLCRLSLAALAEKHGIGEKGTAVLNAMGVRRAAFTPERLQEYAEYCCNDTVLCSKLFSDFLLQYEFPVGELKVIDITLKMFTDPVLELDLPLLEQYLADVRAEKEQLMSSVTVDKTILMSNDKLASALTDLGVDPPQKRSLRTKKMTWAFGKNDEGFKALLEHADPRVYALIAARLGIKSTLHETRAERFVGIAKRGTLPIPLTYCAAISTRWGGAERINIQNLPSRGAHNTLKKAIVAPEGHVIIDCDSSQIEARVLAFLAGQHDLLEGFREQDTYVGPEELKPDVYKTMAARIYGIPTVAVDDKQRFIGKAVVLGAGYGMGVDKFLLTMIAAGVQLLSSEANRIISTYRTYNSEIVKFWEHCAQVIDSMLANRSCRIGRTGVVWAEGTGVTLPNGLRIEYPNLRMESGPGGVENVYDGRYGSTKIYGAKLVENICQAVARCIIAEQMTTIASRYRVVLTVHDANACVVPVAEADEAIAFIQTTMRTPPNWAKGLPLNCSIGSGRTYGDC